MGTDHKHPINAGEKAILKNMARSIGHESMHWLIKEFLKKCVKHFTESERGSSIHKAMPSFREKMDKILDEYFKYLRPQGGSSYAGSAPAEGAPRPDVRHNLQAVLNSIAGDSPSESLRTQVQNAGTYLQMVLTAAVDSEEYGLKAHANMLKQCDPSRLNSAYETLDSITLALHPLEVIISGADAALHLMYHNALKYDVGLRTEDARQVRAELYECFRRSVPVQRLPHNRFTERALAFQERVYLNSGRFQPRFDKLDPSSRGNFDNIRQSAFSLIHELAENYTADASAMGSKIRELNTAQQATVLRLEPLPGNHRANAARSHENDTCRNCGGRGHWAADCPSGRSDKKKDGKGKDKKGKNKGKKGSSGESSKGKEPATSA